MFIGLQHSARTQTTCKPEMCIHVYVHMCINLDDIEVEQTKGIANICIYVE